MTTTPHNLSLVPYHNPFHPATPVNPFILRPSSFVPFICDPHGPYHTPTQQFRNQSNPAAASADAVAAAHTPASAQTDYPHYTFPRVPYD